MKTLHSIALGVLILAQASCAFCGKVTAYPSLLSRWERIDPPASGSPEQQRLNWSECKWQVLRQRGQPCAVLHRDTPHPDFTAKSLPFKIKPSRKFSGQQYAVKVADGWLVAFNAGEWGGSLWWFAPNGRRHYKVSDDQICGFVSTHVGLLALEGLAHLTLRRGQIVKIAQSAQGVWRSTTFVPLGDAPEAVTEDADSALIVVTSGALLRVRLTGQLEVLIKKAEWGVLYPNSIVRASSGEYYVGARGAVVHIKAAGGRYDVDWLLPDKAFIQKHPALYPKPFQAM